MTPEQADILVELERHPFFEGLYDVVRAGSPEWPTTLVVLHDDSGYALGAVTASLLRVLPDCDRAHVGVIASKRLRDLLLPLSERLTLDPLARVLATARASAREAARPPEPVRDAALPALPSPKPDGLAALKAAAALRRDVIWRLSTGSVAVLEVASDPFRAAFPPPPSRAPKVVVLTRDHTLVARFERRFGVSAIARANGVEQAVEMARSPRMRSIVCGEDLAFGDDGLIAHLARAEQPTTARVFVVCAEGSAEWVATYARNAKSLRIQIEEEPLDADALARVIDG